MSDNQPAIRGNIILVTTDIKSIRLAVLAAIREEFGGTYDGEDIAEHVVSELRRQSVMKRKRPS